MQENIKELLGEELAEQVEAALKGKGKDGKDIDLVIRWNLRPLHPLFAFIRSFCKEKRFKNYSPFYTKVLYNRNITGETARRQMPTPHTIE